MEGQQGTRFVPRMPFRDQLFSQKTGDSSALNAWRHTHFGNTSSRAECNAYFFHELEGRVDQYFNIVNGENPPPDSETQQQPGYGNAASVAEEGEEDVEYMLVLNEEWAEKFRATEQRRRERDEKRKAQKKKRKGRRKARPKPTPLEKMYAEVYPPSSLSEQNFPLNKAEEEVIELECSLNARFDYEVAAHRPLLWPEAPRW
eukprot:gb/GECG01007433.1/.p1 GENE.gb/GECG01007433.1/~~gb/GECG01007433.1/.p1  ORF type:complete len:202 (+),score=40.05 gb/GECG01007433.1/:1-606(+)